MRQATKGTRARGTAALLTLATLATVTACGAGAEAGEPITMRLGTPTANDIQQAVLQRFAELVAEESEGRVEGEVYPASQLGGNQQMLELVQVNGIQGTTQPSGFYAPFAPEFGVLELPFLFEDAEQRDAVLADDAAMAPINEAAEERGLRVLFHYSSIEGGQGLVSNTPIRSAADLRDLKIRYFGGKEQAESFERWGAGAVSMPLTETYTSLQLGIIDATASGKEVYAAARFYDVAPYFVETGHSSLVLNLTLSKEWYDSLPEELRGAVNRAAEQVEAEIPAMRAEFAAQADAAIAASGTAEVIELPEAEIDRLRELVEPVREDLASDPDTRDVLRSLTEDR
ncbi:TRAP transporter substrate-binding protein [Streptomyces sp. 4N509B]|uniref:TRAP transporter substrate-binding protein n=1 Tax=Streptomyces sp. 4N509B TaxID=3457413 RepID=UPI003FD040FF